MVSKNHDKYFLFLRVVKDSNVNVENIYEDIPLKKRHLEEVFGFGALNGKEGKWVVWANMKNSRVGKAYLDHYNRARREHRIDEEEDITLKSHDGYLFDMQGKA